jgi:hypothetical protein
MQNAAVVRARKDFPFSISHFPLVNNGQDTVNNGQDTKTKATLRCRGAATPRHRDRATPIRTAGSGPMENEKWKMFPAPPLPPAPAACLLLLCQCVIIPRF